MTATLPSLRRCFEGAVPSVIATCAPDGTPNTALLSQVHYIDPGHVALSYQFFNKTRENILVNPRATVQVVDPVCATHHRLHLEYLRTETQGPLFENMKAKLAGIASHTGMSKVFRLLGSDVYRVLRIEPVPGDAPLDPVPHKDLLPGLRACLARLGDSSDLAQLLDHALQDLESCCGIRHSMLLMFDESRDLLYTVASYGYPESGVGSEIGMGEGIIGVAAQQRTPIRIGYAAQEYLYSRVTRLGFAGTDNSVALETEIPFPGLADSRSQLAVPLLLGRRLLGVLFVESQQELRFGYEEEDALVVLAAHLALAIELMSVPGEHQEEAIAPTAVAGSVRGDPCAIRHFAVDHSVFIDNEYLIKGVAGAIIWRLLREYVEHGRTQFSNRELRRDPSLRLPDIADNLEARLILLQRRLTERCPFLGIVKTGRGRFSLKVDRPIELTEAPTD